VALIYCAPSDGSVRAGVVENAPWQIRAKRAGLSQKELATLLGVADNTVSLQLRGRWKSGIPQYVQFAIIAWEKLSQDGRDALREEMRQIREVRGE